MKRVREWILVGVGAVMAAALAHGGELVRGAVVAALGALGAALVSRAGRRAPRWPRLGKRLGRRALAGLDERLEPALDAAEDALAAVDVDGARLGRVLVPVADGVVDLVRRAVGLSTVRSGHEATLARIELETRASALEQQTRAALLRVGGELEQIRSVLATVGPSVRHLHLLQRAQELDHGQAPAELDHHVASLRDALDEELAHA
jgi:hypothetical protein